MASASDSSPRPPDHGSTPESARSDSAQQATYTFRTADGQVVPVPPDGTLGLLAAGYRGIMLWRQARAASGWTPAKAAQESRAAFREYKQAAKADGTAPSEPVQ